MRTWAQEGWVRPGARGGAGQPPHETLLSLSRLLRSLANDLELQVRKGATT